MKKPFWYASENWHKNNQEMLNYLKSIGYKFEISSNGYQVWYKKNYLSGAGTIPGKKRHWKHVQADSKMYLFQAVLTAVNHLEKLKG